MALVALITWWSSNAFIPVVSTGLAQATAKLRNLDRAATLALVEGWKKMVTNYFNLGGLIGTLLTIPAAKYLGRKTMYFVYFLGSAAAMLCTFGLDLEPETRLAMYFLIGLTVMPDAFMSQMTQLSPLCRDASGSVRISNSWKRA